MTKFLFNRGSITKRELFRAIAQANSAEAILHNFTATRDPNSGDDSADGYSRASFWKYNGNIFICSDNTLGAAVWDNLTLGSVGGAVISEEFTDLDGSVGLTITHNLGYFPSALCILSDIGDTYKVVPIDEHLSENAFSVNFVGTHSGIVIYYINEGTEVPFEDTDSITVTHNLGYFPKAIVYFTDSSPIECFEVDEHLSDDAFKAEWIGDRTGKVIYYPR